MARRPLEVVHIAITCADDTVAIMALVTREYNGDGSVARFLEATVVNVDAEIARASQSFDRDKVPIKGWRPLDPADVPKDRTFRNALRDNGVTLHHDMPHARAIHREHLRHAREPKLAALDIAYQRADERGDTAEKQRVAEAKQRLRDVTAHPAIDSAITLDDLKAVWPESLL